MHSVLRCLVLHKKPAFEVEQSSLGDFPQYLDDASLALAAHYPESDRKLEATFNETFDTIAMHGGADVSRRPDPKKGELVEPSPNTAFEIVALGIGFHVARQTAYRTELPDLARRLWSRPETRSRHATGRPTEARSAAFIQAGRELVSP